jgi:hypothetical protein
MKEEADCELCSVWQTKRSDLSLVFWWSEVKKVALPPPSFVAVGAWEGLGLGAVWREIALLGAFSLGR